MKLRRDLIDNPASDRMKKIAQLSRRSFRIKQEMLLVEGPQAITSALVHHPTAVSDLYYVPDSGTGSSISPQLSRVLAAATPSPVWVHQITTRVAQKIAPSAQGIFATVQAKAWPEAYQNTVPNLTGFSVLLPQTQDPGNLGTIIRLADACGADRVLVCTGSADPTSPKVIRSSAGSVFHLPVHYPVDFTEIAQQAKQQAVPIFAAELRQSCTLDSLLQGKLLQNNLIWAFGNEAHGFTDQQLNLVHQTVSLPMWGKAESFNVASAAAIILHATGAARHS